MFAARTAEEELGDEDIPSSPVLFCPQSSSVLPLYRLYYLLKIVSFFHAICVVFQLLRVMTSFTPSSEPSLAGEC